MVRFGLIAAVIMMSSCSIGDANKNQPHTSEEVPDNNSRHMPAPEPAREGAKISRLRLGPKACASIASKRVVPQYPASHTGKGTPELAAVDVSTDEQGRVLTASVLEAPDAEIGLAAREAALDWTFTPATVQGKPIGLVCVILFYFTRDGKGSHVTAYGSE